MAAPIAITALLGEQSEWEERRWFPPGPRLAMCLSGEKERLADLSDAELVEVMAASRRQTAWAQARELEAVAELSRRRQNEEAEQEPDYRTLSARESVVEEVAVALTVTGNAAALLVSVAARLSTALLGTRAALGAGRLDFARTKVICDAVVGLPDEVAERVEAATLDVAPRLTTGQLRRHLKKTVRALAPEQFEERAKATIKDRRLELWESTGGTADLALLNLAPEDAHAIHNKITAVARALKKDGDDRTLNVIRADLAKELLRGSELPAAIQTLLAEAAEPPTPPETTAPVTSTQDASSATPVPPESSTPDACGSIAQTFERRLTAVRDRARTDGRLSMLAALTTQAAQEMTQELAEARDLWCQATGPDPTRHGHPGYRPPAAMQRLIERRHPVCVFPTCNRRSEHCDLDHTIPYRPGDHGGVTCRCNLAPLCRRHHRAKQSSGWRLFQPWPGLLIWITPSGKWHIILADRQ